MSLYYQNEETSSPVGSPNRTYRTWRKLPSLFLNPHFDNIIIIRADIA